MPLYYNIIIIWLGHDGERERERERERVGSTSEREREKRERVGSCRLVGF